MSQGEVVLSEGFTLMEAMGAFEVRVRMFVYLEGY